MQHVKETAPEVVCPVWSIWGACLRVSRTEHQTVVLATRRLDLSADANKGMTKQPKSNLINKKHVDNISMWHKTYA